MKTIFEGQMGWFSGYPEELKPLSPKKRASGIVEAFGAEQVLKHGWVGLHSCVVENALKSALYSAGEFESNALLTLHVKGKC